MEIITKFCKKKKSSSQLQSQLGRNVLYFSSLLNVEFCIILREEFYKFRKKTTVLLLQYLAVLLHRLIILTKLSFGNLEINGEKISRNPFKKSKESSFLFRSSSYSYLKYVETHLSNLNQSSIFLITYTVFFL